MFSNKELMKKDRSKLLLIINFIIGIKILSFRSIKIRTILSFSIFFIMLIFVIFYIRYTYDNEFFKEKKKEGIRISNFLFQEINRDGLFNDPLGTYKELRQRLTFHLHALNISRLNFYDKNNELLYISLFGPSKNDKKTALKAYKTNKSIAFIKTKNIQVEQNLPKASQFMVVYIPNHHLGVFEIYLDITYQIRSYQKWGIILIFVIIFAIGSVSVILVLVFHQIKTRESELIRQKELAEKANRSKDNFLARVSHEIKNPLNGILGFGELAKIRFEEEKAGLIPHSVSLKLANEDNATILECGRAINRFIDDLNYFNNVKEGHLQLLLEKIDFQEIIQSLNNFVDVTNKNKDVSINLKYDKKIKTIFSDKIRLNQVLNNFASNAIKFTEKGQINIDFSKLNDTLIITISDSGIGFSKDEAKRVFDDFYQVEHKSTYEGLGLGLAIVKQLVILLKGKVQVESERNVGSTFTLILPHHIC